MLIKITNKSVKIQNEDKIVVKQQSEFYTVRLPSGVQEKRISLLGRILVLKNGETYSGIVPKTFPEYFETSNCELLIDDSSNVTADDEVPNKVDEAPNKVDEASNKVDEAPKGKPGRPKKEEKND